MSSTDHAEQIRGLGREILPAIAGSQAVYAAEQETEPYAGVAVSRGVAYGPHERHRLDAFTAEAGDAPRPVFVFVHGGGFVQGGLRQPGSPYNDNVALWAVRNGMVGINVTYRLAPEFTFPAGSEDLAASLAWVREHAVELGGDPDRIFVMGTSAGAVHVANFIAHDRFAAGRQGVAGAIYLSGVYDLTSAGPDMMAKVYYGEDASLYPRMSPLPGMVASPVPQLLVVTEFDPLPFQLQALTAINAWVDRHGEWPDFLRLMGHNHLTSTFHLNTADDYLGRQMLTFMRRA